MIYVASSWRNDIQPIVVQMLRTFGYEVYDFKDEEGFHWSEVAKEVTPGVDWKDWSFVQYQLALKHGRAVAGFTRDMKHLDFADAVILVLPCGRSAHLEAGYAIGKGKPTFCLIPEFEGQEAELMYKMFTFVTNKFDYLALELEKYVGKFPK